MAVRVGNDAEIYTTIYLKRKSLTSVSRYTGARSSKVVRPDDNKVKGYISEKSMKRIQKIAENWTYAVNEAQKRGKDLKYVQFTFCTLTLASEPPENSDRAIKNKLLNPFLQEIRKLCGGNCNYIWRVETHPGKKKSINGTPNSYEATGRLHFHIIFDRFLPRKTMIAIWNRIQDRMRLVEKSGWVNPQGVYIEMIPSASHVASYITKYICKDSELSRPIDGKQWGCSDNLAHMKIQLEITEMFAPVFRKYASTRESIVTIEILEGWINHYIDKQELNSDFWKMLEVDNPGIRDKLDQCAFDNYQMHLEYTHKLYKFLK